MKQFFCEKCGMPMEGHEVSADELICPQIAQPVTKDRSKMIKQEKWVAVRPDGSICGPIDDDADVLKKILIHGYVRTVDCFGLDDEQIWKKILESGYSIHKGTITIQDV